MLVLNVPVVCRGTIDDCEMVDGLVLTQKVVNSGLSRMEKAKIGLIQFCLSPPKTDVSAFDEKKLNWRAEPRFFAMQIFCVTLFIYTCTLVHSLIWRFTLVDSCIEHRCKMWLWMYMVCMVICLFHTEPTATD